MKQSEYLELLKNLFVLRERGIISEKQLLQHISLGSHCRMLSLEIEEMTKPMVIK